MANAPASNGCKGVLKFLTMAAIGVVLYAARSLCIPFALAIRLSSPLAPLVSRIERWHFSRVPAVLMTMMLVHIPGRSFDRVTWVGADALLKVPLPEC